MRKIVLICVGTLKENYLKDAISEYQKRIQKFFDFKIIEVSETKLDGKPTPGNIQTVLKSEGEKILEKISPNNVASFCIEGSAFSSTDFANLIEKQTDAGTFYLIIGGSYGLNDNVKNLGKKISFGKITLPHQLMRVVACEQIYRAATILNNIEYHK